MIIAYHFPGGTGYGLAVEMQRLSWMKLKVHGDGFEWYTGVPCTFKYFVSNSGGADAVIAAGKEAVDFSSSTRTQKRNLPQNAQSPFSLNVQNKQIHLANQQYIPAAFRISTLNGRTVLSRTLSAKQQISLPQAICRPGIYLIEARNKNQKHSQHTVIPW
jgi:hypothetical protein